MDVEQLRALRELADSGSVVEAARRLKIPRSTLRGRLGSLEAHVGRPLIVRTEGGPELTPMGHLLLERAERFLDEADRLDKISWDNDALRKRVMRVLVPVGALPSLGKLLVESLRERLPGIRLSLRAVARPERTPPTDVDLIVHFGPPPADGPFYTTIIGKLPLQAMASPDYLERAGRPERIEDLEGHCLQSWTPDGAWSSQWPLVAGGYTPIHPELCTNEGYQLRLATARGEGISLLANSPLASMEPTVGPLEVVLPKVIGGQVQLSALIPEARRSSEFKDAALEIVRAAQSLGT